MKKLHIADTEQVRAGEVTDVYFLRTEEILRERGLDKQVYMEVFLKSFPEESYRWGVFAGLEEVLVVLEGRPVTVRALPEGSVFSPRTPVMTIEGKYLVFGELETTVLGCLCQASGIATRASRYRLAAGRKLLVSFGARRMHPAIAPMVERAAFIGGCDGVAAVASARLIGEQPSGTIPHALILIMGDTVEATRAFDDVIEKAVPRVSLIDTFNDEKFEALRVAESLGAGLYGVRLDTPSSRKGNFRAILEEVRWELDLRGFSHVKLFVSGGLGVPDVIALKDAVDAFGVGTGISSAASLDFSMDIVEIDGRPIAKRGKQSGRKSVLRCTQCMQDHVVPFGAKKTCSCPGEPVERLVEVLRSGSLVSDPPAPRQVRARCLEELSELEKNIPAKELLGL